MTGFLDRLRARPPEEKQKIALLSTLSIFALIFMVWWTTFTSPLTSDTTSATDNLATPIAMMGNVLRATRDGVQNLPSQLMQYVQHSATSTSGADRDTLGVVSASDLIGDSSSSGVVFPGTASATSAAPTVVPESEQQQPSSALPSRVDTSSLPPPSSTVLIPTKPKTIAP